MTTISEFVVLKGSLLEGLKLEDIVNKYNVEILHYHNPTLDLQTKTPYNPNAIIQPYFYLKVAGSDANVAKLRLDSVKYN